MGDLEFRAVTADAEVEQWQHIHNVIVPPAALTAEEVRERADRNRMEVVYLDGKAVANSTVRPPEDGAVTVIVRVLKEYRRQGIGEILYKRLAATVDGPVETVIYAPNTDGLEFALKHGFEETERYELDGAQWVTLRLARQ